MQADLPEIDLISASRRGPIVAILSGVHGDEYEGVLAARRLAVLLRHELVAGSVRISAPAHPAAWRATTRESSRDGLNLARVFPGSADGTPTERVAFELTHRQIRGADLVIDLHSAGSNYEMPFLCGYQRTDDAWTAESERFASVFGADFSWKHVGPPASGRSLSVAYELRIPAVYTEASGGRSIRYRELRGFIDGCLRVLHELDMVESAPNRTAPIRRVTGDGNTDQGLVCPVAGYLVSDVACGQKVRGGEVIAEILGDSGESLTSIRSPGDRVVMMRRRDAHVEVGDSVFILASEDVAPE